MSEITLWLAQHGGLLLMGSTVLLLVGALAVGVARAPVYRQRLGELTIAITLVWLVLAAVPLPRWGLLREPDAPKDHPATLADGPTHVVSARPPVGVSDVPVAAPVAVSLDSVPESSSANSPEPVSVATPSDASDPRSDEARLLKVADAPAIAGPIDWPHFAAGAYLIGAGLCALWLLLGRLVLAWRERTALEPDPWLVELYETLLPAANRRPVHLLISPRGRCPVSYGLLRPRIVLPADLCRPESRQVLRHVLLHELAHVERRDARGHALLNLAFPVLFGHPLYWLLRRQVHFARELIADDWAAGFDTPQSYAEGLIGWLRQQRAAPAAVSAGLGIIGASPFRHHFSRRMKMLIDRKKPLSTRASLPWTTLMAVVGLLLSVSLASVLGSSPAGAEQPSDEQRTEATLSEQDEPRPANPTSADDGLNPKQQPTGASASTPPSQTSPAQTPPVESPAGRTLPGFGRGVSPVWDLSKRPRCSVELVHDIRMPASTEGLLLALNVHEGTRVKKGQRLARLDDRRARQALDFAMAEYETAKQQLSDVNVRYAEAALKVAEQEFKHAEAIYARIPSSVSLTEIARLKLTIERAKLQLEQSQVDQKGTKAQLKVHGLRVNAAVHDVDRFELRALQDGIIVETYAKVGQWLKPGDPVCRVVRFDRLRVVTSIPGEVSYHTGRSDDPRIPSDLRLVTKRIYDPSMLDGKKITVVVETRHGQRRLAAGRVYLAPLPVRGSHRLTVEVENRQEDGHWVLQPTDRPTLLIEPAKDDRPSK